MKRAILFVLCGACATVVASVSVSIAAGTRAPGTGMITIGCTSVQYSFSGFPSGTNVVNERITLNGTAASDTIATYRFVFNGPTGSNTVPISVPSGTNTVYALSDWRASGTTGAQANWRATITCPATPCPPGTGVNLRWHYSSGGSSGSWSGTYGATCPGSWTTQQQAMEGALKINPLGAMNTIDVGYDITVPGNQNPNLDVTVSNPQVVFTIQCADGSTPSQSTWTVTMPTQMYAVTDGSDWFPSGDQHSGIVYQAHGIPVPNFCSGADVDFSRGGVFTASVS